jgi:uncharacterized protein YaiL (DUF2058 family)
MHRSSRGKDVGNSLQDQLLKAGLVDEQRLRQTKTARRKKKKGARAAAPDAEQQRLRAAAMEKAKRDRELDRQRQQAAAKKAEEHALRQLIHAHRVLRGEGDVAFNFEDGGTLKRLYVTSDQQRALVQGLLAVVRQDAGYELVSADIAGRILARNASLVLVLNRPGEGGDTAAEGEDPYADYKVPDDLMW